MPRSLFGAHLTACLSLFVFLAASSGAMAAVGGGGTNTTTYSTSTRTITHDTVVNLPPVDGGAAQTFLSSLLGSYPNPAPTGFALDRALADPVVQRAVVQAQQAVLHTGGTLFADATSGLTGGNPVFVGPVTTATNVSATTTMYIGPQTIMIGDNQSQSFSIVAGGIDYDTLFTTDLYQNLVYQLMGTTLTGDVPGLALIGTNAAGQIEVLDTAALDSLSQSGLPVAFYQRKALLNMVETATNDVNGHLFRLHSRAMNQTAGMSSGDAAITGRWQWFGTGGLGDQSQDAAGGTPEFDSQTYAGTVGAEYSYSPQLQFGFAGTGMKNHSDLDFLGDMDITGLVLSAYGTWMSGPWYVDGLYGFGMFDDDIERNTLLGSIASASPDAFTHTFNLNTGYNLTLGKGLLTGPTLGAAYTHGRLDGYTETGGGSANLKVDAQSFDSLITDLGWQMSYGRPVALGQLTFQGRTSWRRENLHDNDAVRFELLQSPFLLVDPGGGFTRTGGFAINASPASAQEDYWVLGAGVRLEMGKGAAVLLNGEEHFGSQNREQFVSVSAQFSF